jgi:hypothetical protein
LEGCVYLIPRRTIPNLQAWRGVDRCPGAGVGAAKTLDAAENRVQIVGLVSLLGSVSERRCNSWPDIETALQHSGRKGFARWDAQVLQ